MQISQTNPESIAKLPAVPEPVDGPNVQLDTTISPIASRRGPMPTDPADARVKVRVHGRGGPFTLPSGLIGGGHEWTAETWLPLSYLPKLEAQTQDEESAEIEAEARRAFQRPVKSEVEEQLRKNHDPQLDAKGKLSKETFQQAWDAWHAKPHQVRFHEGQEAQPWTLEGALAYVLGRTGLSLQGIMYGDFDGATLRPFYSIEVLGRLEPQRDPRQQREQLAVTGTAEAIGEKIGASIADALRGKAGKQ